MLSETFRVHDWGRPRTDCTTELLCPNLIVRTLARMRRSLLDHALAAGADPSASPLLAARAAQLVTLRRRQRLAAALEDAALTVDAPRGRVRTPPLRAAVRPNRDAMLELAQVLRQPGLLYARGVAMVEIALTDGTGPAYTDPRGEGLARQLALAAETLTN